MVCEAYERANDFNIRINFRIYKMIYEPRVESGSDFEVKCKTQFLDNYYKVQESAKCKKS